MNKPSLNASQSTHPTLKTNVAQFNTDCRILPPHNSTFPSPAVDVVIVAPL